MLADQAETSWPETLVLDWTRFIVENVRTGTQTDQLGPLGLAQSTVTGVLT